jgi:hypothetical protein
MDNGCGKGYAQDSGGESRLRIVIKGSRQFLRIFCSCAYGEKCEISHFSPRGGTSR